MSGEIESQVANKDENDTVFGKILRNEIPSPFIHEDDFCVAFADVIPLAPTHVLVIPRKCIKMLSEAEDDDSNLLGHLLITAKKIAEKLDLKDGYRLVINNGVHACQTVNHLHIHILGGKQLSWPLG